MRRLLAFLALLSGLAAVNAPAHAALLNGAAEHISASETAQSEKQQKNICRNDKRSAPEKSDTAKGCKTRKTVIIFIPTVQFGPDRAFE